MKTPCELVVGKMMPSLRASVVKELSGKYHMKQAQIARKLGITQASVSQYLSSARAGDTKMVEDFPKIRGYASEIAKRIADGEERQGWSEVLCEACRDIREDDRFLKMQKQATKLDGCDVCRKK